MLKRLLVLSAVNLACAPFGAPLRAQGNAVRLGDGLAFDPYALLQLDEAGFRQSAPGGQAASINPRRFRLGGRLDVANQVEFGVIWDFGHLPGSEPALFEAQASYIGWKPFRIIAGVFKTNFGLESMQDAGDTLFLERASIATVTRNLAAGIRRQGVQIQADGDRYNASVAITAGQAGPGRDGNQRAAVARAAGLPVRMDDLTVHVGVSAEWLFRPARAYGNPSSIALSDQTELQVDDRRPSLSTPDINAGSAAAFGPELGAAWRRLWLQGEYYRLLVDRRNAEGGGTLAFEGWYAQAAWTVLGQPRRWSHSTGAWGAPKPAGPFNLAAGELGAVELGARFSTVDLNSLDVGGGRQKIVSAVANWWPVAPVRLSLLYEHATVAGGPSPRTLDAVGGRVQLQF
jgi:phosphate-selective porin OprO/OprP